ncbi:MAG: GNAT family N-acetyltransferase [Chloroflexota bacterium]|nr:GNAT family N-acetyltransferase [Chloroflexota bacterium]
MAFHTGQSYCQHAICIGAPDVEQLRTVPKARDVEESVSFYLHAAPTRLAMYYFCIYQHALPVGQIMLHDINARSGERLIGYHLFRIADRGQGIGTIALALLQAYVQTTPLTRLIIITSRDHTASQQIATKCGFHVLGPAREDPEHLIVFAWDVPHVTSENV